MAMKKISTKNKTNNLYFAVAFALLGLMVFSYAVKAFTKNTDANFSGLVEAADQKGFDEFGYNRNAGIFNGKADGVDKVMDGKLWGDPTYANDKLVMKWNSEWDRGNAEGWNNPPYDAWEDNEWNGRVRGGTGEVWHYKIIWVGNYNQNPDLIPKGAYGVWGQFAVIMDMGKSPDMGPGAIWFAHAKPNGLGAE